MRLSVSIHGMFVSELAMFLAAVACFWRLHARRPCDGALPDDDDARRHGGERPLGDDVHPLDVR